jgi:DnaJ-class molecular chaperone
MTAREDQGYINYYEILGIDPDAKPGEVRNKYRRVMKDLVGEITSTVITEERRSRFLLRMAQMNAALFVLRDQNDREAYWTARKELITLEAAWRGAVESKSGNTDEMRREYDRKLRDFLSKYVEETMLQAGRDRECVEACGWDEAHERHAFRILRHYRQSLYQQILERLPYVEVTPPQVDWEERDRWAETVLAEGK